MLHNNNNNNINQYTIMATNKTNADHVWFVCTLLATITLITVVQASNQALPCSEAICGPRVSKCMLIKSCNCTITKETIKHKNCTCCAECVKCLDSFYTDCCSCVGLCSPPSGISDRIGLKSYVDELFPDEDGRHLFRLLVDDQSYDGRWTVHSFPALSETIRGIESRSKESDEDDVSHAWSNVNCTVAYVNQCLSSDKCTKACESMGASSYRWFHSGCCECVGEDCINYGSNVPRCAQCQDDIDQPHSSHDSEL